MTISLTWLDGNKVYIIAVLVALVSAAQFLGWITMPTAVTLLGLLGAGGIAGNRVATSKALKTMQASKG